MTKTIDTLATDIKGLFGQTLAGDSHTFEQDMLAKFGSSVALHVQDALTARRSKKPKTLYMSEIGKPCRRQVWYGVWHPELAEPMQDHTLYKFLYGNVIEEIALLLAEAAGHDVTERQKLVEFPMEDGWKVRGKQDAIIDEVMVDVKSCSPFGYKKFEEGLNDDNDSFGYRLQLDGYNALANCTRQGFLAIDKQNGHVGFFEQPTVDPHDTLDKMVQVVNEVKSPVYIPDRRFDLVPEGKSGNMKLGVECSYCPYKHDCWPGLRTFASSRGPVFLGTVKREPNMPEIKTTVHPITIHKAVYRGPVESHTP